MAHVAVQSCLPPTYAQTILVSLGNNLILAGKEMEILFYQGVKPPASN
jgi:hypothetical protein